MEKRRCLLIEDDAVDQMAFRRLAKDQHWNCHVTMAGSLSEAKKLLEFEIFDVVISDYLLGDGTALDILALNLESPVIVITGAGSEEIAVQAMKGGAYDYLIKDPERKYLKILPLTVEKALVHRKAEEQVRVLSELEYERTAVVGTGSGLDNALQLADLASSSDMPVLITGETGTGKSLIAKAIHFRGPARREPFLNINCACLPETLIEAELFGYEKGAFTGASTSKKGLFEAAGCGTILLDEVAEMRPHLQARLLGVIEERATRRLGGVSLRPFRGRIIASTNVDIEATLGKSFRKDLFFRLSVMRIHLPPLRERRQDIPALCSVLLRSMTYSREVRVADEELARLAAYNWPGNVRELKNVLERAVLLHKGSDIRPSEFLQCSHQEGALARGATRVSPDGSYITLDELERGHIATVLESCSGSITKAARILGISISTLKRRLRASGSK